MRSADWLVDMGPGAGERRPRRRRGPAESVEQHPESVTGQFISGRRAIARCGRRVDDRGSFRVLGASMHNLKGSTSSSRSASSSASRLGVKQSTLVNEIVYKSLANRLHRMRVKPGDHEAVEGSSASTR